MNINVCDPKACQSIMDDWNFGYCLEYISSKYGVKNVKCIVEIIEYLVESGYEDIRCKSEKHSSMSYDWTAGESIDMLMKKYGYKSKSSLMVTIRYLKNKGYDFKSRKFQKTVKLPTNGIRQSSVEQYLANLFSASHPLAGSCNLPLTGISLSIAVPEKEWIKLQSELTSLKNVCKKYDEAHIDLFRQCADGQIKNILGDVVDMSKYNDAYLNMKKVMKGIKQ